VRIDVTSRNLGFILAAVLLGASSSNAWAARGRVGLRLSGTQAGPARDAIAKVLAKHGLSVVGGDQLEATAANLHVGLGSASDMVAVAGKLKLVGIIAGDVGEKKAAAVVRSGSSGKVTARARWSVRGSSKKLIATIAASTWAKLGRGLRVPPGGRRGDDAAERLVAAAGGADDDEEAASRSRPHPADSGPSAKDAKDAKSTADLEAEAGIADRQGGPLAKSEPPPAAKAKPDRDVSTDEETIVARPQRKEEPGVRGQTLLELGIGPRLLWRDIHYDGTTGPALVPFKMNAAPTLGVAGAFYPGAGATTGFGGNIGIAGSFEYASGISSKATDGVTFPTAASDLFGGLRVRLPLGARSSVALTGGYGRHAFVFHSTATADRANIKVPDVDNRYLRGGGDLHIGLGDSLSFNAGGGYRRVLSVGGAQYQLGSAEYFPHATVVGYDVTASLGYHFAAVMEVQVGYDLRQYTYTTNAAPGDPIQLKSFADKYNAFWLTLGIVVDGKSPRAKKAKADDDET